MSQLLGPMTLALTGSTGNNNHAGIASLAEAEHIGVRFVVEVAGATPTVTWKLQGALVPEGVVPAATDWVDIMLRPSDSDTGAVTRTHTAVGSYISHLPYDRDSYSQFRLVTSSNTNVTYRAELYAQDEE